MAFHSTTPMVRERILSFGGAGTGKSFDLYTIFRLLTITKSDAQLYVIDTDESAYRMLLDPYFSMLMTDEGYPVPSIHIEAVHDWAGLMSAVEKVKKQVQPHDWTLIDMVSPAYDWSQQKTVKAVYGTDLNDFYLQKRKEQVENKRATGRAGTGTLELLDWNAVKHEYADFADALLRWPSHLYGTAEEKAIDGDKGDKDTVSQFKAFGVVPTGQKRTPHLFQTVIRKTRGRTSWEMTTIKDRSRPLMAGQAINDFAKDYLMKVAGWRL